MAEPMNCGTEFTIRNPSGQNVTRFVWLCGNWLGIQPSGYYPADDPAYLPAMHGALFTWQGVLQYLARLGRRNDGHSANGHPQFILLGPVMRVSELARLLGQDPEDIRKELTDLVLQVDDG